MGQKTNSTLLRLGLNNNGWKSKYTAKTSEESSLTVFKDQEIQTYLSQFLANAGLIFHDYKIHINYNTIFLYVSYLISLKSIIILNQTTSNQKIKLRKNRRISYKKTKKLSNTKTKSVKQNFFVINSQHYKRQMLLKKYKNYFNIKTNSNIDNLSEQLLETINLFTNRKSNIYITFKNLNSNTTLQLSPKTWKNNLLLLKKYRKQKFFKETINVLLIVIKHKNSGRLLAEFLAKQLTKLSRQSYFLIFIKRSLELFVRSSISEVCGVKIIINGRFNGRPRARNNIIAVGNIPTQTLKTNIDYHQSVAFSSNGTFGIKVWISEKSNNF